MQPRPIYEPREPREPRPAPPRPSALPVPDGVTVYGEKVPVVYGTTVADGKWVQQGQINRSTPDFGYVGDQIEIMIGTHAGKRVSWIGKFWPGEIAFCQGPATFTGRYWRNDARISVSSTTPNGYDWTWGLQPPVAPGWPANTFTWIEESGSSTSPWTDLTAAWQPTGWYSAEKAVPLYATAHVRTNACISSDGESPNLMAEISGFLARGGATGSDYISMDAHPADVLRDICQKMGIASASVETDVGADGSVSSSFRRYCDAEEFFVSRRCAGETAEDLIADLMRDTNSVCFWSEGRLKVRPMGDTVVTGTNTSLVYVPVTSSVAVGHNDLMFDGGDPIAVTRRPDSECFNAVPVTFLWRPGVGNTTGTYAEYTVEAAFSADVVQRGMKRADAVSSGWIKRTRHAERISYLLGVRSAFIRNTYTLTLGPAHQLLEPGDFITLTEPVLGLNGVTARVSSIEERDEKWEVTAEEWPVGAFVPVSFTSQRADGLNYGTPPQSGSTLSLPDVANTGVLNYQEARQSLPFNLSFDRFSSDDWYFNSTPTSSVSLVTGSGSSGGGALRTVGQTWLVSNYAVPYDPTRLYKFRARFKQVVDDGNKSAVYIGFSGLDATGTLCNVAGANSNSSQHYAWIQVVSASMGWVEAVSYYRGLGSTTGTQNYRFIQVPNVAHPNVRWMRPMFITNYPAGTGTCLVDVLEITEETLPADAYVTASTAQTTASAAFTTASWAFSTATVAFNSATTAFNSATQAQATASQALATGALAYNSASTLYTTKANLDLKNASAVLGGGNLLPNSSFESYTGSSAWADNWNNYVNTQNPAVVTGGVFGGNCQYFECNGAALPRMELSESRPYLPSGTQTVLSAYVSSSNAEGVTYAFVMKLMSAPSGGAELYSSLQNIEVTSSGWSRITASYTLPSSSYFKPQIGAYSAMMASTWVIPPQAGTKIWVDAVQLEVGSIPTAYAPKTDEILPGTVGTQHITASAITTEKIAANAIVSSRIAAGSISGSNIAAGTITTALLSASSITAPLIASKVITADHLVLGLSDTLFPNGNSEIDPPAGYVTSSEDVAFYLRVTGTGEAYAGNFMRVLSGAALRHWTPCMPGETYLLDAYMKSDGTNSVYGYLQVYQTDKTTYVGGQQTNTTSASTWTRVTATYTVPASGSWLRTSFLGAGNQGKIDSIVLKRKTDSTLIVNGCISGTHIAAQTISGTNLAAATISGTHIAASTIQGSHIQASTISTSHLKVGGLGWCLNDDPMCLDSGAWLNLQQLLSGLTDISGGGSTAVANTVSSNNEVHHYRYIPVDQTKNYRLDVSVKRLSGSGDTNYLSVAWYDQTGTLITSNVVNPAGWSNGTYSYYGLVAASAPTTWTTYGVSFGPSETAKIPSSARFMRIGALLNYNATAGVQVACTNWRLVEKTYGTLLVDGCISASHIATNGLQLSSYSEDGSGNPTAGAKIFNNGSGPPIKVAPAGIQVGNRTLDQAWFGKTSAAIFTLQSWGGNSWQTASAAMNVASCYTGTTLGVPYLVVNVSTGTFPNGTYVIGTGNPTSNAGGVGFTWVQGSTAVGATGNIRFDLYNAAASRSNFATLTASWNFFFFGAGTPWIW